MRKALTLASSLFLGLTLLVAGTGKLPGQAEFVDALLQSFWTPGLAYFIAQVVPWGEIALGMLLLVGLVPRLASLLSLPLISGFIANNAWALGQGVAKFPQCGQCFGVWEKYLGEISPAQALTLDVLLLAAALAVVIYHPTGFLHLRPWFIPRRGNRPHSASDAGGPAPAPQ